jgi:type IV pilus assembly protein PilN
MIDSQNRRNELLKTEIAELDKAIEQILALEEQKARMISRMEVIDTLQASRPEVVKLFDQIVLDAARGRLPDVGQAERQEDRIQRRRAVEHARLRLHAQHRLFGVVDVA